MVAYRRLDAPQAQEVPGFSAAFSHYSFNTGSGTNKKRSLAAAQDCPGMGFPPSGQENVLTMGHPAPLGSGARRTFNELLAQLADDHQ